MIIKCQQLEVQNEASSEGTRKSLFYPEGGKQIGMSPKHLGNYKCNTYTTTSI